MIGVAEWEKHRNYINELYRMIQLHRYMGISSKELFAFLIREFYPYGYRIIDVKTRKVIR